MPLIQNLGYVRRDLSILRSWWKAQLNMDQMHNSRYAFNRTHKWFKHSVILKKNPIIKAGNWDEKVFRLGDRIYPQWDCALLCHYRPGGCMITHTDHVVFHPFSVLVVERQIICPRNKLFVTNAREPETLTLSGFCHFKVSNN